MVVVAPRAAPTIQASAAGNRAAAPAATIDPAPAATSNRPARTPTDASAPVRRKRRRVAVPATVPPTPRNLADL